MFSPYDINAYDLEIIFSTVIARIIISVSMLDGQHIIGSQCPFEYIPPSFLFLPFIPHISNPLYLGLARVTMMDGNR